MFRSRAEIKGRAWQSVKQNYWPTIGAYALVQVIASVIGYVPIVGYILYLLVTTVITVGFVGYFLSRYRGQPATIRMIFDPFHRYGRVLGGMLWKMLWLFLWTLLFIIPGIVKMYSYFCTEYILWDSPNVGAMRALELSKRMMHGNKARVFVMHLSFLGWALLGIAIYIGCILLAVYVFTVHIDILPQTEILTNPYAMVTGIVVLLLIPFMAYLILFFGPYITAANAGYFDEIKRDAIMRGVVRDYEFFMTDEQVLTQNYYNQQYYYGHAPYGPSGQPIYGPTYGQPGQPGQPIYGPSPYDPSYGQPGQTAYGPPPMYGQPPYEPYEPTYGQPVQGPPQYGQVPDAVPPEPSDQATDIEQPEPSKQVTDIEQPETSEQMPDDATVNDEEMEVEDVPEIDDDPETDDEEN